jgi:hypothetical protein
MAHIKAFQPFGNSGLQNDQWMQQQVTPDVFLQSPSYQSGSQDLSAGNIQSIIEKLGGIDGIVSMLGEIKKIAPNDKRFAQVFKLIDSLLNSPQKTGGKLDRIVKQSVRNKITAQKTTQNTRPRTGKKLAKRR